MVPDTEVVMITRNSSMYDKWILIVIASASIIVVGVWPLFVGVLAGQFQLDVAQQGWVISVESFGMVAGTAITPWLSRRVSPRGLLWGTLALALVMNIITAHSPSVNALMLMRFVAGLAAGLCYSVAVYHLARMSDVDRAFGMLLALQTVIFCGHAVAFPHIAESYGPEVATYSVAAWYVFMLVLSLGVSQLSFKKADAPPVAGSNGGNGPAYLALLGMGFLQLAIFALWGFIGTIGAQRGITEAEIGMAFGIGLLGGLPGAAIAGFFGTRLGRRLMISAGALVVLLAVAAIASGPESVTMLTIWIFILNFGWMLALSFYMGLIAASDTRGVATSLIGLVQIVGATLAPTAVALFTSEDNLQPIFILSCTSALIAAALPQLVSKRARAVQSV